MVTFSGYIKSCVNFGTIKSNLSKAGTFHQEVLHQRIDSGNDFLRRSGIAVFLVHTFCGIFPLVKTNSQNHFVLVVYCRRTFPFVAIYSFSIIQIIQTPKRN